MNRRELTLAMLPIGTTATISGTSRDEKPRVRWLGQICYMVDVKIDGDVYPLPNDDGGIQIGIRSDGVVVWRPSSKRTKAKPFQGEGRTTTKYP